jgi:outer membrane receptor protein involved in Fe transport
MNSNRTLSCAIAAILGGNSGFALADLGADAGPAAPAAPTGSGAEIQEIVVTAQRRTENLQDVPIAIQALTAETLTQLNATTFDDFVKYLPNVTTATNGPGQGNIYMRGLGTTGGSNQSAGVLTSFPNVAVYLDDQSGQLPGRNLDVYAADLERIEILEGPQGTLFGAGAQAGVVRYITNKPKLDVTEGNANAGYEVTAHGDPSSYGSATLNVPLIADTLAVRAVIYDDARGGYINNVPGTFTRAATDRGIIDYFGGVVPTNSVSINNSSLVGNAINPVTYTGIRASALLKFNDDWSALLVQSYQNMNAQGVFYETPESSSLQPLPDLSVQLYNPSYDKDKFENTALTVDGRIGSLKLVYAGGYLVRHVEQAQDYTNYARGVYADYYQCSGGGTSNAVVPQCFSPSATWTDTERATHQSHEIRLSTPDTWRLRAIGGLFWEEYKIVEDTEFNYKSPGSGFYPIAPPTGALVSDPSVRGPNTAYIDDLSRGYQQRAAFGSFDFDLVPQVLTFTAGSRYYKFNNWEEGATVGSFGCRPGGTYAVDPVPDPCINVSNLTNLTAKDLRNTTSGAKSRVNLSWHVTADALLYYTWSQGFRPGGFNRSSAQIAPTSPLYGIFKPPLTYSPDTLINNELGWKTEWFDRRLEFNGAFYIEDWKNAQITIFDPGVTGNQVFTTNGPDYRVRGLETSFVARVTHELSVIGSAAWNSSRLTNEPTLTQTNGQPLTIANPYGQVGSPLAMSPPIQSNLRVRYEFDIDSYHAFWQIAGTHQGHSYATTDRLSTDLQGNSIAYDQAAFSTLDASIGVSKDSWTAQLYGQNLTDTRADLFSNYGQFVKAVTVNRPRTLGLRFSYNFL